MSFLEEDYQHRCGWLLNYTGQFSVFGLVILVVYIDVERHLLTVGDKVKRREHDGTFSKLCQCDKTSSLLN